MGVQPFVARRSFSHPSNVEEYRTCQKLWLFRRAADRIVSRDSGIDGFYC